MAANMDTLRARLKGYGGESAAGKGGEQSLRRPTKRDVALVGISLANPAFTGDKLRAMVKLVKETYSDESILLLCDSNHAHNLWAADGENESADENGTPSAVDAERYRNEAVDMGDEWIKRNWSYIGDLQPNIVRWDEVRERKSEWALWQRVMADMLQNDEKFNQALDKDVERFTAKLSAGAESDQRAVRRFRAGSTAYILEECIVLGVLCAGVDMVLYPGRLPDSVATAGHRFNEILGIDDERYYKLQHREIAFRKAAKNRGA